MKKYILLERDYQYDDNFYSHDDEIDKQSIKVFDYKEKAEEKRKELSRKKIFTHPTNGKLDNVLNDSGYKNIKNINVFIDVNFGHSKCITENKLTDVLWDELYSLIRDLYYVIKEDDIIDDKLTIKIKSEYSESVYKGIIEDGKFLLHSLTEPADKSDDGYDDYNEYYIKGIKLEKKEWVKKSRQFKISNLLDK